MSEPTIAAIIPVYNRPSVVLEALASAAAQTRRPDQLIIVDDGSTDDTAARIEAWLDAKRPRFPCRLIRQANRGAAGARNRGAAEAGDCELLAFLDSDDLWPADYVQRMAAAFARRADTVAATCDILVVRTTRQQQKLYRNDWAQGSITGGLLTRGTTGTPNTVIRATAYRQVGGQDEQLKFAEDRHLFLRLSLLGPWAYVPGDPVINRMEHAAALGEQDHFGYTHKDVYRIHAEIMEQFVTQGGGAQAVAPRVYRRALARWWYKGGRQLAHQKRRREAHDCFRRGLRWWWGHPRLWWNAIATYFWR